MTSTQPIGSHQVIRLVLWPPELRDGRHSTCWQPVRKQAGPLTSIVERWLVHYLLAASKKAGWSSGPQRTSRGCWREDGGFCISQGPSVITWNKPRIRIGMCSFVGLKWPTAIRVNHKISCILEDLRKGNEFLTAYMYIFYSINSCKNFMTFTHL